MPLTNVTGIPLSMAVMLAHDTYDHDATSISATALIKPLKQLVLAKRVPPDANVGDVSNLIASTIGTAVHDALESAWVNGYAKSMLRLGYPQKVIDQIIVNPTGPLTEDQIPVYLERRSFRVLDGVRIGGKFDFVAQGRVEDLKNTSVYTYINKDKDQDYILQGSIYRWLNEEIITEDTMAIQFRFTDWTKMGGKNNPRYPKSPILEYCLPLMSVAEIEHWLRTKLADLAKYDKSPEDDIPECTDKELWRKKDSYAYYKNPDKLEGRSTKNFDNLYDAQLRVAKDGNVGTVVERKGAVVACGYCPALSVCKQKNRYILSGELKL